MYQCYTWSYRLEVPPYDKVISVLEAFFASYPGGDYTCEERDKYKLAFRRGQWRKSFLGLGPRVPNRLVPGDFSQWPILVRTLVRPSPQAFTITVRYELYLPRKMAALKPETQASVDQHARMELAHLADYLAECIHLHSAPRIQPLA